MSKNRPIPDLSPEARREAVSELSDLSKRLAVASHSVMQKAVSLASDDRTDHEKAIRSMRRYRGSGQPDHGRVLDIEATLTGLSVADCLAYSESQSADNHLSRKAARPVEALTLAEHETDLIRLFREGTTAQRAAILGVLGEDEREKRAQAEESARRGSELDRLMKERFGVEPRRPAAVERASLTVIDGGL